MNRIIARILQIESAEKVKRDYTNLEDPKNFAAYEKAFDKAKVEDATGKINPEVVSNRMLQTPEYVTDICNKYITSAQGMQQDLAISDDIFGTQVNDEQTVQDIQNENPDMVNRDNPKKPKDVVSPYKTVALLIKPEFDELSKAERAMLQDRLTCEQQLTALETAGAKSFLMRFFGEAELKRRAKHYRGLIDAWDKGLQGIYEVTSSEALKLASAFTEINEKGKAIYDPKVFSHTQKKGDEFIRNLKAKAQSALKGQPQNKAMMTGPANDIQSYLYSAILSGDGLSVVSKRIEFKRKLTASISKILAGLFEPCEQCGATTSNEDKICKKCKEKENEDEKKED